MLDLNNLKTSLQTRIPRRSNHPGHQKAAVVVLITGHTSLPSVLLTQRSDTVQFHKKEVSFPGGMHEPEDMNLEMTAIRELREETGIDPDMYDIIGRLDDVDTTTGFIITPFVGIIREIPEMIINRDEIDRCFFVPLQHLRLTQPVHTVIEYRGREREIDFCPWDDTRIWGATLRILQQLIQILEGLQTSNH